jgi:putative methionine-R-sulfoxide reductase with GAF domain
MHPPFRVPGDLQVDYQRLLTETAHLLLQECDADTLCGAVFELIREPFELDVYFHYLVSEDETRLELASCGGTEGVRAALGSDLAFGQAVCGTVAQHCESMYLTDIQKRTDEMTSLIRGYGVRCYTCQPLVVNGQILGTLSFGSCRRDSFAAEELDLFRLIAQQVNVVTERRRHNDHMRQLEQLATAGRMCATIAHEINNPLYAITNLLYLIKGEVQSEQGKQLVALAEDQIVRLTETAQRTLDLFRGRQQEPQPVDLSAVATELLSNMRLPNGISLRRDIAPGVVVRAVPGRSAAGLVQPDDERRAV